MTRHDRRRQWMGVILGVVMALPTAASAVGFTQGRYTFGVSGGFGRESFSIGGSFGYVVVDGLQPSVALGYTWQGGDLADAHQLRTRLELRYYLLQSGVVAPYLFGEGQHIYLAYRGVIEENHNFFLAGGGGGLVFFLADNIGLEIGVGLGTYLGAEDVLYRRGTIDEGLVISGRFGINIIL